MISAQVPASPTSPGGTWAINYTSEFVPATEKGAVPLCPDDARPLPEGSAVNSVTGVISLPTGWRMGTESVRPGVWGCSAGQRQRPSQFPSVNFLLEGLSWWLSSEESICQRRRPGFDPWVGKIPWRRKNWQPAPAFLLGKFHGQRRLAS